MHLAKERDKLQDLVNMMMNSKFLKGGEFLDYLHNYFSTRTLLHGVT
jgi:hypothetical protein